MSPDLTVYVPPGVPVRAPLVVVVVVEVVLACAAGVAVVVLVVVVVVPVVLTVAACLALRVWPESSIKRPPSTDKV